jgi:hypothetical protein
MQRTMNTYIVNYSTRQLLTTTICIECKSADEKVIRKAVRKELTKQYRTKQNQFRDLKITSIIKI